MPDENYYAEMLDLEGLDPERETCELPTLGCYEVAALLRSGRCKEAERLLARGGKAYEGVAEKVMRALRGKNSIFGSLQIFDHDFLANMGPRALAEAELSLWRPGWESVGEYFLAVERPVRSDWLSREVDAGCRRSVENFYRSTESYIFELMAANNIIETLFNYDVILGVMRDLGVNEFLDYGAGIGSFILAAQSYGLRGRYMDLPSRTLDYARWRFRVRGLEIETIEASGQHTDLPNADCIVCTEVIEHVFEPVTLLDAIQRALPIGGYLVVSESCAYVEKFISHLPGNRWLACPRFCCELERRGFREIAVEPRVYPRVFLKEGEGEVLRDSGELW